MANSCNTINAAPGDTDSAVAERLQLLETCLRAGILSHDEYEARRAKLVEGHRTSEAAKEFDPFRKKSAYMPTSFEAWGSQAEARKAMDRTKTSDGLRLRWKFLYRLNSSKVPRDLVYQCALHVSCPVRCKISLEPTGFLILQKTGSVHGHQLASTIRANARMTLAQEVQFTWFCLIIHL